MTRKRLRFIPSILPILTLPLLFTTGCASISRDDLPFVTVREADYRCGPVDLPVTPDSKRKIASFLQRGGDWGTQDVLDLNAPNYYEGLFDLLSNEKFLRSGNFRDQKAFDRVSAQLHPWFHGPIIYQLVDATQKHPLVPSPICVSDGKYWWIFYTQPRAADADDLKITKVMLSAPLSRTLQEYPKIRRNAKGATGRNVTATRPAQLFAETRPASKTPADMHAVFLRQLLPICHVQLVSRLKDERLGHPTVHGVRIFIPDMHLLSKERGKDFTYTTNYVSVLTDVAGKLIKFKQSAAGTDVPVTVYQLGDCVDLWREERTYFNLKRAGHATETDYQKVLDDHFLLARRLYGPELATRKVLGNHDFQTHEMETCVGAELRYYFPYDAQSKPVAVVLHGNIFDWFLRDVNKGLEHWATYRFGPDVRQNVYDLSDFSAKASMDHATKSYKNHIQLAHAASLGKSIHIKDESTPLDGELTKNRFNVQVEGDPSVPTELLKYLPAAESFTATVYDQTGWDLRFMVIGHTHMARIVLDERPATDGGSQKGFFALVDCGAWLEEGDLDGKVVHNAQIGVLYDNDMRIYQLSPK